MPRMPSRIALGAAVAAQLVLAAAGAAEPAPPARAALAVGATVLPSCTVTLDASRADRDGATAQADCSWDSPTIALDPPPPAATTVEEGAADARVRYVTVTY